MLALDNPFWTFSISIYGAPGVADECIALQDTLGIDVNVLLFCAWVGASHAATLDTAEFRDITTAVNDWQKSVVRPLREVRRALKPQAAGDHDVAKLREQIMRDELQAERIEQALLHARSGKLKSGAREPAEALRRNVAGYLNWHTANTQTNSRGDEACERLIAAVLKTLA